MQARYLSHVKAPHGYLLHLALTSIKRPRVTALLPFFLSDVSAQLGQGGE